MRIRFTIRDLHWLLVLAGLGVAWWADHTQMNIRCQHMQDTVDQLIGGMKELREANKELRDRILFLSPADGLPPAQKTFLP
jgi:hypothetical protein